jgi:hypothetical protein
MFIVMDITNYMKFVPFFVDIYHVMIYNKFNKKKLDKNLIILMYLLMIEGHKISIELEGSVFNDLTQFNINAHFYNGNVLINLNVLDAWYSGINYVCS